MGLEEEITEIGTKDQFAKYIQLRNKKTEEKNKRDSDLGVLLGAGVVGVVLAGEVHPYLGLAVGLEEEVMR